MDEFTWGGFVPYQPIPIDDVDASDFTLLVSIGTTRAGDKIYLVPTREVRISLRAWQKEYLGRQKLDGGKRKDTGQWNIRLTESRKNPESVGYGFARKWQKYLENWKALEKS